MIELRYEIGVARFKPLHRLLGYIDRRLAIVLPRPDVLYRWQVPSDPQVLHSFDVLRTTYRVVYS